MRYLDIIINTLDAPDLEPMDLDRDAEMIRIVVEATI